MLKSFAVILFLLSGSSFSRDLKCYRTFSGSLDLTDLIDGRTRSGTKYYKNTYNNPFFVSEKPEAEDRIESELEFLNIGPGLPSSKKPIIVGAYPNKKAPADLVIIPEDHGSSRNQYHYGIKSYALATYSFIWNNTPQSEISLAVTRVIYPRSYIEKYTCY